LQAFLSVERVEGFLFFVTFGFGLETSVGGLSPDGTTVSSTVFVPLFFFTGLSIIVFSTFDFFFFNGGGGGNWSSESVSGDSGKSHFSSSTSGGLFLVIRLEGE